MSQIIELGVFSPDIAEVVRQLKQDLKDDWYPDSLGYEDVLQPEVAGEFLATSFERNHGLFVPEGRTELNIPKKGFVLRYSLEMRCQCTMLLVEIPEASAAEVTVELLNCFRHAFLDVCPVASPSVRVKPFAEA